METHTPTAGPRHTFLTLPAQLSGLALFAETVWVTADQYRVYPLMGVSGKDDVFAGAWIAIFCGFSFFVVASFGVGAALCRRRSMVLTVRSQDGAGGTGHHRHGDSRTVSVTQVLTSTLSFSKSWPHTLVAAVTPVVQRKVGCREEKDGQHS